MKIEDKISLLKKTIKEIINISRKIDHNSTNKKKIDELNTEITNLKKGIKESVEELEEFIEDNNA